MSISPSAKDGKVPGETMCNVMLMISAMVAMMKPASGEVKFPRMLQVGLTILRDLFDRGMGLDREAGLDPALFFNDGTWFFLK